MFVLPVRFSMVTNDPVGESSWSGFSIGGGNFSMKIIVKSIKKTSSKIHVTNWVNAFWEVNTSWKLSISSSPVVFNTFHVPLVYKYNNFLVFTSIDLFKKVFVSSVNKGSFKLWEINS